MSKPLEYDYQSNRPVHTLLYLLNRKWYQYLFLILLFVIKLLPNWATPFLLARIINTLADPAEYPLENLPFYFMVMVILALQNILTHTFYISLLSRSVRRMEKQLRSAVARRLQQLSIAFHDRTESGRLQIKVLRDVEQIQVMCMFLGEMGLSAVLTSFVAIAVTAFREPRMLIFYIVLVPLSAGLRTLFRRQMRERNREFRSEVEQMSSEVTEMISMIPVARAHGLEAEATQRSDEQFQAVHERGRELDMMNALFASSSWVTFQITMLLGLAVLSWLCWKGWINVGEIVLFQGLFGMIVMSVTGLLNMVPQLAKGMESIRSLGEVIECPDIEYNEGRRVVESVKGDVRFEQVGFRYENARKETIANFSLNVVAGECIAFVGESGAGKSTVVQLLNGFHRAQKGSIFLDETNMEELDMRTFRRFVSVVPQETVLFSGSMRENITYGRRDVSEKTLRQILRLSNLTDMVEDLPEGLDTRIGEDGALLSGGQRQRIAIARALVRDPSILILDEATSALDVVSEKKVQEAIDHAIQNRTTFIVAHRLSTIRQADRIVVMKEGQIAEIGSYEELMARGGLFCDMQKLQH